MADYKFDDWKKTLEELQSSVQKGLAEMRQQKMAVQQLKTEVLEKLESGKFLRDDERIVISAPEIVIGNVDKSGDLLGGTGCVVVKGNSVGLEGVGESGQIVSRATSIQQIAVDPGTDGVENVVWPTSEIVSHACDIVLQSDNAVGAFSQQATSAGRGGIRIHAERSLDMDASYASAGRLKSLDDSISSLTETISELEKLADEKKKQVDQSFKDIQELFEKEHKLNDPENFLGRVNLVDIEQVHDDLEQAMPALYHSTMEFIQTVSQLAEANRVKKSYEEEKERTPKADDLKKMATNASMSLAAETINLATVDGDGNLHTNASAGIGVRTPRMNVNMVDNTGMLAPDSYFNVKTKDIALSTIDSSKDGKEFPAVGSVNIMSKNITLASKNLMTTDNGGETAEKCLTPGGRVAIAAQNIEVTTVNSSGQQFDDKGQLTKAEFKAEGSVYVNSKFVTVESFDYDYADKKLTPKGQTAGSSLAIQTENTRILSADAEGKAAGTIDLNAKAISVKSMNVDKEKLTDDKLAEGGTMILVAEKMYTGALSKDVKSKKIQMVSEEIGAFADNTLEIQQGDGKAVVQLDGGNASVGGGKTQVYGDTTINAKAEVKGELKAPKISGDSIEAKSAFKSPNISDGFGGGAGGGGGSLSAKLKTEDAPKK